MIKDLKMKAKGQAALEFIMTYGWAILVVLVAIGALAYFGVLSPDRLLPNKCILQAGISCVDHKADRANNTVQARLTNTLGYDISGIVVGFGNCDTTNTPSTLANGASATYTSAACNPAITDATKYTADLNVSYTVTETGVAHKNTGSITSRVE